MSLCSFLSLGSIYTYIAPSYITILSVEGRVHPVDILYSEKPVADYLLAAYELVNAIHAA